MSEVSYTLIVDIADPYGGDSLTRLLPTEEEPTRTVEDVLKAEFEKKVEEISNIIKGDIQLRFVSITEA